MAEAQGTHLGGPRPIGGFYSSTEPEKHPGRKIRKARQRLAKRQENLRDKNFGYDSEFGDGKRVWVRTRSGKIKCYRIPGSTKCK